MHVSTSAFSALLDIFVAPRQALAAAREHTLWFWLPLVISIALTLAFWAHYYFSVDFDWLITQMLTQSGKEMPADQMEQVRAFMTPVSMLISTAVFALAWPFVLGGITALYLLIVAKIGGDEQNGYGRWFGLSIWAFFPAVVSVIAAWGNWLLASSKQLTQQNVMITNLNTLLFHKPLSNPWAGWLGAIDLTLFWCIALLGIGVALFSNRSLGKGLTIAIAPFVVVYGIWAIFILI